MKKMAHFRNISLKIRDNFLKIIEKERNFLKIISREENKIILFS